MAKNTEICLVLLASAYCFLVHVSLAEASFDPGKEIIVNPETQTAKPGDEVVFWCVGNGVSSSTVLINSTAFDSSNRDEFESQGINETKQLIDAGTYNLTTTVLVSEWMNNTELRCRFDNGDYTVSSEVAFLIVAGPPLSPRIDINILDRTSLQVSWNEPFTWPGFEIQSYSLLIRYTSSGSETNKELDSISTSFILMRDGAAEECEDIEFFLTATSDVGESSAQVAFGGFPKDTNEVSIETDVSFQSNGNPQVDIWVKLENACDFLAYNYTLSIKHDSETLVLGDNQVEHIRSDLVHARLGSSLTLGDKYEVTAKVDSLVDSLVISSPFSVPTVEHEVCKCEGATQANVSDDSELLCGLNMWIVVVAVFLVVVALLVATASLVLYFTSSKRRRHNCHGTELATTSAAQSLQNNPLYEGAIYETLDGLKPLDEKKTDLTQNGTTNHEHSSLPHDDNTAVEDMALELNEEPSSSRPEAAEHDTYLAMGNVIIPQLLREDDILAIRKSPPTDATSTCSKQLTPSNTYVTMHEAIEN